MTPEIVMNHATFRKAWRFDPFVEACAAAGMRRVSIWGNEVDMVGLSAAGRRMRDCGLTAFGYNRAGPLLSDAPDVRADLIADAKAEIDKAAELEADHVLIFPGGLPKGYSGLASALSEFSDTALILLEHARACGITLALEPLHPMLAADRTVLCTMTKANDLCDRFGAGVGIVVDSYHVWWDDALEDQITRAGANKRILALHVNDWLVPTTDMLNDRGMMGDGVIDLGHMWRCVRRAGYSGPVEVELFSDRWWAQDPNVVLRIAMDRCAEIFSVQET